MEYSAKEVGRRLQALRRQNGCSREKIAKGIGKSVKYYGDIERGSCGMSVETLLELSKIYHVSLDYLVRGIGDTDEKEPDAETAWMINRVGQLDSRKRSAVLQMLGTIVELGLEEEREGRYAED